MVKLGYSTYALQDEEPVSAVGRLREIGYEAVEIAVSDGWETAPDRMNGDARRALREAIGEAGFPSPVLMNLMGVCAHDEDRAAKLEKLRSTCKMARELNFGDRDAIVTTTLGRQNGEWEAVRDGIVTGLKDYADVVEGEGAILAIEPHIGQVFDTPEKAAWIMAAFPHPNIKLNFDHSHFHLLGIDVRHALKLVGPHSVHTHIKDGFMDGDKVQFQLPGEGSLDLVAYLDAVEDAGLDLPIVVEVSRQIWGSEGYAAWETAEKCFGYLDAARSADGRR